MKRFEKTKYHTLESHMIPAYVKNQEYIKLLMIEVYDVLNEYQGKSPIAIGDFALWLHGFNDEAIYRYLYEKNKFQLPSIDIFATITECNIEKLKLIEPIPNKGKLIKVRVFNYRANNVLPISYQSGFKSRQQLFDEAAQLTVKILDIDVVPFYFLEWLPPTSSVDRAFIKEKINGTTSTSSCTIF